MTEAKALAAVGNEIDRLRDKLMWLHALVHETDLRSRSDSNQQIRVLAYQVREVAFAAEDAIDHFFLQADLSRFGHDWRQATSIFFSNLGTQIRVRYILSRKIKSMNTRLEDIVDNSAKYRSDSDDGTTKVITWRASRAIPPVRHNWDDTDLEKLPDGSTMLGDSIAREDLLKGAQGSKIVLTATSSSRADNNNVHVVGIIKLGYLKNPKSETLFNRILGLRGRKQTTYKTTMMNKIRNRIEPISKGLPLAVALLAKFMRTMDHSKWEAASEYIQMNNQDNVLMTMVSMCIDDLPNEHRSCLLYTAGFLARSTIDASQLVRLWVAEGFLSQQHGVSQEELGQRYLKEFICRGLMQLVKKKGDVVESVAIHDLVHQIFRSEAQRIGLMETHNGGGEYASVTVSARRLALNNSKMPYKTNILWKVRTLLFHDPQGIMGGAKLKLPSRAHVDKIKEGSQKLKEGSNQLLKESTSHDAQGTRAKLPNRIGNMLHLQYLSVRCSNLTTVKKFPTSFWKIKTLRHVLGNHDLQFHGFCQASEDVVIDQRQDDGLSVHMTIKEHVANVHVSSRRSWMLVST
ncbi:hypothetical protein ZWY2020_042042 [Hordeum vulgare]|nr:hypothetical protein ZWY2020_042042 [Hordeum vulgare]